MKFAFSTNIFRFRPLSEAIEGIAKAGFCAVELVADRPHAYPDDLQASHIAALNQCLEDKKIKVSNLNSCRVSVLGDGLAPSWLAEDWQEREKRVRYTLDCLRLAAALGIPHVTITSGGLIPESMNRGEAWRLFVASMHRVLPLAQKLGVKLLVQPGPGLLVETTDHMLALLNELEFHEKLGVDFDAGHFYCAMEDLCEAWKKLQPYCAHVHLEDVPANRSLRHIQLGEGAMDIPGFLECIEESNYKGFVTVKLDAYEQRAEEMVSISARYLRDKGYLPKNPEVNP